MGGLRPLPRLLGGLPGRRARARPRRRARAQRVRDRRPAARPHRAAGRRAARHVGRPTASSARTARSTSAWPGASPPSRSASRTASAPSTRAGPSTRSPTACGRPSVAAELTELAVPGQPEAERLLRLAAERARPRLPVPRPARQRHGRGRARAQRARCSDDRHRVELEVHPDLFVLEREGEEIRIEQVARAAARPRHAPVRGRRGACTSSARPSGSARTPPTRFLKSLEEPPAYATFLLLTHERAARAADRAVALPARALPPPAVRRAGRVVLRGRGRGRRRRPPAGRALGGRQPGRGAPAGPRRRGARLAASACSTWCRAC